MYAATTTVDATKTRGEIEKLLRDHGADEFAVGSGKDWSAVTFRMKRRYVRFRVELWGPGDFRLRTASFSPRTVAQQERQRWRALLLVVKAKLEAVESGIESFEQAFLAEIVLPDGSTVGEYVGPAIEQAYDTGVVQPMKALGA